MKQLRKNWSAVAAPMAVGLALTMVIASCGKSASPTSPSAANSALVAGSDTPLPDPTPDPTPTPTPGGGEGCTPGYWKQSQHFDSWPAAYSPDMLFNDVFDDALGADVTLLDALSLNGGGLNALARHTVAALLNGASDGVSYDLTAAQVIAAFNAAYPGSDSTYETLKNRLDLLNNQGCGLN